MADIADLHYEQIIDDMIEDEVEKTFGYDPDQDPAEEAFFRRSLAMVGAMKTTRDIPHNQPRGTMKMRSRITYVQPEMRGQEQNSYESQYGTMFTYVVQLEDGTRGQYSSKNPAPCRFSVGDEVEFTFTPPANAKHLGRLKLEKPKDEGQGAPQGGNYPTRAQAAGARPAQSSGGWSPAKEASVMIQGLLKSIIQTGVDPQVWGSLLRTALDTHDNAVRQRMAAAHAREAAKAAAAPPPPPPPQSVPPPFPPPAPQHPYQIPDNPDGSMDEELPF